MPLVRSWLFPTFWFQQQTAYFSSLFRKRRSSIFQRLRAVVSGRKLLFSEDSEYFCDQQWASMEFLSSVSQITPVGLLQYYIKCLQELMILSYKITVNFHSILVIKHREGGRNYYVIGEDADSLKSPLSSVILLQGPFIQSKPGPAGWPLA